MFDQIAERLGFFFFPLVRNGLNFAVEEAFALCMQNQADSVLVIPADIPLVSSADVDVISKIRLNWSMNGFGSVQQLGHKCVFPKTAQLIFACFGHSSFAKHMHEARDKGVSIKFYHSLARAWMLIVKRIYA